MTVVTGVLVTMLAAVFPLPDLLALTNIGTLVAFAIVCAGVLALRVLHPNAPRPYGRANSLMNVDYDLYEGETASASVRSSCASRTSIGPIVPRSRCSRS